MYFPGAEQHCGHQGHRQEEPRQVTEPAREGNQNFKGNWFKETTVCVTGREDQQRTEEGKWLVIEMHESKNNTRSLFLMI